MSTLGHSNIWQLLRHLDPAKRLVVTPLFSKNQIGSASIDLRLGNEFISTRRANLSIIDPAQDSVRERELRCHAKHYVNLRQGFNLHPNELVLASTMEYFKFPDSVCAVVTSRSSWGRVGLVIATATAIHPGFSGTITLELVNLGEVPMVLYPGLPVAQLILSEALGATAYQGKFKDHIEPKNAGIGDNRDDDLRFWTKSLPSN